MYASYLCEQHKESSRVVTVGRLYPDEAGEGLTRRGEGLIRLWGEANKAGERQGGVEGVWRGYIKLEGPGGGCHDGIAAFLLCRRPSKNFQRSSKSRSPAGECKNVGTGKCGDFHPFQLAAMT
jgi:hypothetical protein